ncbi:hypothetical protein PHSY_004631 [Pseudozyma hubeiensis SY62]|uniref:Uncharacterized protein n=1 Tax=Pseudozyma hubeiensis (strain SY62) TaxID=1305764 RepID=R9P720_PSEHS|nr:hypothetical protein PHSY_004631 [Pseudozyma hubeiensis SY62]GAC97047.1 hypothetical protein PHSY_004631 [Pseudozyma hubeiensis SY62]
MHSTFEEDDVRGVRRRLCLVSFSVRRGEGRHGRSRFSKDDARGSIRSDRRETESSICEATNGSPFRANVGQAKAKQRRWNERPEGEASRLRFLSAEASVRTLIANGDSAFCIQRRLWSNQKADLSDVSCSDRPFVLAVSEDARKSSGPGKKVDDRHLQAPGKDAASTLLWQIQLWKSGSRNIHYAARFRRASPFDRRLSDFIWTCNEPSSWPEGLRTAGRER